MNPDTFIKTLIRILPQIKVHSLDSSCWYGNSADPYNPEVIQSSVPMQIEQFRNLQLAASRIDTDLTLYCYTHFNQIQISYLVLMSRDPKRDLRNLAGALIQVWKGSKRPTPVNWVLLKSGPKIPITNTIGRYNLHPNKLWYSTENMAKFPLSVELGDLGRLPQISHSSSGEISRHGVMRDLDRKLLVGLPRQCILDFVRSEKSLEPIRHSVYMWLCCRYGEHYVHDLGDIETTSESTMCKYQVLDQLPEASVSMSCDSCKMPITSTELVAVTGEYFQPEWSGDRYVCDSCIHLNKLWKAGELVSLGDCLPWQAPERPVWSQLQYVKIIG